MNEILVNSEIYLLLLPFKVELTYSTFPLGPKIDCVCVCYTEAVRKQLLGVWELNEKMTSIVQGFVKSEFVLGFAVYLCFRSGGKREKANLSICLQGPLSSYPNRNKTRSLWLLVYEM